MNFRFLLKRTIGIIKTPERVWSIIDTEPRQYSKHFRQFALPYLLIITVALFIGQILYLTVYDYSFLYVLVKTGCIFLIYFFTLYVAIKIISELNRYFQITIDQDNTSILLVYSMVPFFVGSTLAHLLINYPALGNFLKCCGLYGIYILYRGTFHISGVTNENRTRYCSIITLIVTFIYLLLYWSISNIWKAVFYFHMLNK
jgi:hypothetical protein